MWRSCRASAGGGGETQFHPAPQRAPAPALARPLPPKHGGKAGSQEEQAGCDSGAGEASGGTEAAAERIVVVVRGVKSELF